MAGLLDGARLIVTYAGVEELGFQVGDVKWGSGAEGGDAWCEARAWEGSSDRRVSCVSVLSLAWLWCADDVM